MGKDKFRVMFMGGVILGVFILSFSIIGFDVGFTGYAVFSDDNGSDFDEGVYVNTEWNGSAVVLSGNNLSGSYVSRVFDSGVKAGASWNNLSYVMDSVIGSEIYLTSAVHVDLNHSEVFDLDGNYYLVDMKDNSKRFYLNFSSELEDGVVLKMYTMLNKGVALGIYSQEDDLGDSPLGVFSVDSSEGEWYNVTLDMGSPTDAVWIGEGSGSGVDPKENFDYIYAEVLGADISFEVMNCSVSDCSDGFWQDVDLSNVDLRGRYFRYKVSFSSDGVGVSASLSEVVIDYDLMNSFPVVDLVLPVDTLYTNGSGLFLNFSVVDDNVDSCWYDVNDGLPVSLPDCLNVTFDVDDGAHTLTVYVNDSFGEVANDSVDFFIDAAGVDVELSEPVGEKGSRVGVLIVYSSVGADECWYNVKTSIGGAVIENTSLVDCSDSSFDVSADGDYVLNLFANNSFGSFDSDSESFSVDSSVVVPPVVDGGSSGGGGSVGSVASSFSGLEIEPISVVVFIGEEKSLLLSVKNKGRVAANKCSLVGGDYVDSDDIVNIGVGEIVDIMFVLSILDEGAGSFNLSVVCLDDVMEVVPLNVVILKSELDVSIGEISFDSEDELLVKYSVESMESSGRVLVFSVLNSVGDVVAEVDEEIELVFGEDYEGEVSIDISDVSMGMLKIAISDDEGFRFVEENFIYGGSSDITGLILLDLDGEVNFVGIGIFLIVILLGILGWRFWKLQKKS